MAGAGSREVRFFVAGSGLFTLHVADKVYEGPTLVRQGAGTGTS